MMDLLHTLVELSKLPVTYAQHLEDVILFNYLHKVEKGFYVDVGCNHHEIMSVTKMFYDLGWTGINIDPLKSEMDLYKKERRRDINICIGISDRASTATLYGGGEGATLNRQEAEKQGSEKSIQIKTIPLATLLDQIDLRQEIHFLKIDVEHHEKEVLLGCDFHKYRPWVVAIESTLPGGFTPCHEEWEYIMHGNGYVLLRTHEINRYYCPRERKAELTENYASAPVRTYIKSDHRKCLLEFFKLQLDN